jgi:hypothetical protein
MNETSFSVEETSTEAPRLLWWLTLVGAGAFYAAFVLRTGFSVFGERYYTLFDDAMISMRYGHNMAAGYGLVWNPGEAPVEGYTNFLWTLWMAAIHLLRLPMSKTSLVVMISGAIILLLQGAVVAATARTLTGVRRCWGGLFAMGLTLFSFPLVYWTLRGMEVGFIALLASTATLCAFRYEDERRPALLVGLCSCIAALVLTRDDAVIIAGIVAAYAVLAVPDRGSRLRTGAILGSAIAITVALHLAFRWSFYGDVLPNTYYLKLGGSTLAERVGRGALTGGAVVTQQLLPLLAVAALLLMTVRGAHAGRLRSRLLLLATLVIAQSAYSVYVGGDAWEYMRMANRYMAIPLPALAILAGLGLARLGAPGGVAPRTLGLVVGLGAIAGGLWNLAEKVSEHQTSPSQLAWAIVLAAAGAILVGFVCLSPPEPGPVRGPRSQRARIAWALSMWALVNGKGTLQWVIDNAYELPMNIQRTRVGLLVRDTTDPDARIAVAAAGSTPYFAERPTIDVLGKCDWRIARMPRTERFMPGHDKQDYAYSFGTLQPDIVVDYFNPKPDAQRALAEFGFDRLPNGIHIRRSTSRVRTAAISQDFDTYGLPAGSPRPQRPPG